MDAAKIRLSAKEMELVANADWILTKNGIIDKVKTVLEGLQDKMLEHCRANKNIIHPQITQVPPKISKGENYKGLPYLILDYPRIFEKESTMAIRTMFWWGNFFSITLQLAGNYKKESEERISSAYSILAGNGFFCCINEDEWQHHFDNTNYLPISEITQGQFKAIIEEKSFIKIAKKILLQQWNDAGDILLNDFKLLAEIISCQDGEKAP